MGANLKALWRTNNLPFPHKPKLENQILKRDWKVKEKILPFTPGSGIWK